MKSSNLHTGALAAAVSRKFYSDIRDRLVDACALLSSHKDLAVMVMDMLDTYVATGVCDSGRHSSEAMMIFTLLSPEIDKAVSRSKSARERALSRKKVPAVTVMKSRSERRREERERRREEARKARKDVNVKRESPKGFQITEELSPRVCRDGRGASMPQTGRHPRLCS